MMRKQKMLMLTFYYDPARGKPNPLAMATAALTEESLQRGVEAWLAEGGLVQGIEMEVDLIRLARSRRADPPTHEWVGLAYMPIGVEEPAAVGAGGDDES
jgi:hypothetical protein